MKRVFIAGVPATGKTTIGNYLKDRFNFVHFDVEDEESYPANVLDFFSGLRTDTFLASIEEEDKNTVITWGFVCDDPQALKIINLLQKRGFKFVWFYAEKDLARKAFLERGTGSVANFDTQMNRIKNLDLSAFDNPTTIVTLQKEGRKNKDEIVAEIMKL